MLGIRGEETRRTRSPSPSDHSLPKRKKVSGANQGGDDLDSTQQMLDNIRRIPSEDYLLDHSTLMKQSASCGILEKVLLINFMCHKRLEVDFNSNVNFIHGRNGSGKSAIMTGVVVGLGGKASATSRGSSAKGFVRSGASFAEVTIWLKNRGVDAYRPEVYGTSIEIVRRISLDGSGAYKIKSTKTNAVVSTKKEELLLILDQFNIQVDNPVSLLNQDTSRNFLHVTDAKAKYKLFMKATLLDSIANNCEKTEEMNRRHRQIIDAKEEEIEYEKRDIKELEEQWKNFQKLREMEGQITNLRKELQWACVCQIEKELSEKCDDIDVQRAKITKREEKLQELQRSHAAVEESKAQAEEDLKVKVQGLKSLEDEKQVAGDEKRQKEKIHLEKIRQLKQLSKKVSSKQEEKRALQTRIAEIREKQREKERANARKSERARIEEDLQRIRSEADTLQSKVVSHQESRGQLEHSLEENRRKKERCRRAVANVEDKIRENAMTIRRLQDAKSDRLKGFGHWMPQIIQAINQSREFKRKPVGPLGMYLKVKEGDRPWAFAVECALGLSNLTLFFCDNHHDRQRLVDIFRHFIQDRRQYPDTVVVPFTNQPYNDSILADTPYKTVTQVLKVEQSNPLVVNYLLENRMNRTLLIADYDEARTYMFNRCPKDYGVAFTRDGHRAHSDYRCYTEKRQKRVIYLQSSSDDSLRDLHAEVQKLNAEKKELEAALQDLTSQEDQDKRELSRIRGVLQDEKRRSDTISKKMMHLETELALFEEDDEEEGIDVADLEGEVVVMDEEIEDVKSEMRSKQGEIKEAKSEVVASQEVVQGIQEKIDVEMSETEKLSTTLDRVIQNLGKYDFKCKQLRDGIQTFMDNIVTLEQTVERQKAHLTKATDDARQVSEERIDTKRPPAAIDRQIKQMQTILAQEKDSNPQDFEVVRRKLTEKLKWYDETVEMIGSSRKMLNMLEKSLKIRYKILPKVQEMIAFRACNAFKLHLERRGYRGSLNFDHNEEKLEMKITVDAAAKGTKNQKTLSGGERSFATVCFVLSLWDAIEAPFRLLDEFDVFMDMLNRKMSMKLLLENAQQNIGRQFIFLTPNNMSDLVPMDPSRLSLLVLQPPERGSTSSNE